jgi:hypothetical protein
MCVIYTSIMYVIFISISIQFFINLYKIKFYIKGAVLNLQGCKILKYNQ